jgi:hypothetical protein
MRQRFYGFILLVLGLDASGFSEEAMVKSDSRLGPFVRAMN